MSSFSASMFNSQIPYASVPPAAITCITMYEVLVVGYCGKSQASLFDRLD